MSALRLVINAVICLILGQYAEDTWAEQVNATSIISSNTHHSPRIQNIELFPENFNEKAEDIENTPDKFKRYDVGEKEQLFSKPAAKLMDSGKDQRYHMINNYVNNNIERHSNVDRHQIYKRYLNRDHPMKKSNDNLTRSAEEQHQVQKKSSDSQLVKQTDSLFQSELDMFNRNDGPDRLFDDRLADDLVLNDKIGMEEPDLNVQAIYPFGANDTTKMTFEDLYLQDNIDNKDVNNDDDTEITYMKREAGSDETAPPRVISKRDTQDILRSDSKDEAFKREIDQCSSKAIKEEIDKVYKDISENVRLLTKLRDKEAQLSKSPSKKRWVIVDDIIGSEEEKQGRKKRCSQELSVEIDTNGDSSPDRLEHVERKVEEELLQVNVPLKCQH